MKKFVVAARLFKAKIAIAEDKKKSTRNDLFEGGVVHKSVICKKNVRGVIVVGWDKFIKARNRGVLRISANTEKFKNSIFNLLLSSFYCKLEMYYSNLSSKSELNIGELK